MGDASVAKKSHNALVGGTYSAVFGKLASGSVDRAKLNLTDLAEHPSVISKKEY